MYKAQISSARQPLLDKQLDSSLDLLRSKRMEEWPSRFTICFSLGLLISTTLTVVRLLTLNHTSFSNIDNGLRTSDCDAQLNKLDRASV
jgi:hypothetical protein